MKHVAKWITAAILVHLLLFSCSARESKAEARPLPCRKWHKLLDEYDLPVRTFAPIMMRESKCIERAVGWNYRPGTDHTNCRRAPLDTYKNCDAVASYDLGLLQVNSSWKTLTANICGSKWGDMSALLQPRCNLAVSRYLYLHGGGLRNWQGTSKP